MARPAPRELDDSSGIRLPPLVRFPIELTPPPGFDGARLETWPQVDGRLEWVAGRLLYMPPCGDRQALTVSDVVTVLGIWRRSHEEFSVGTNEAGVRFGEDTRGADAAIWRRADLGELTGGLQVVPPLLAVEVGGRYESEADLRDKARWYLGAGVTVVSLVLPVECEVVVVTVTGEHRRGLGERLPEHPEVPDLTPLVDELFAQVTAAS